MAKFTIAVLDGTLAASVGGSLDVLDFANRAATYLNKDPVHWRVIGRGHHAHLSNGLTLQVESLTPSMDLGQDLLIIPSLGLDGIVGDDGSSPCGLNARYTASTALQRLAMPDVRELIQVVRAHYDRGGSICASCSGVLVLAEAGILAGHRVTTHWALARLFQQRYPLIRLDPACMVVEDGRITTAGAAMAQVDLMLHVLRKTIGREVAESVMRYLLVDSRTTQARYMVWQQLDRADDDTVNRFEALIESSLPDAVTVKEAAQRLNMTAKTLGRRIAAATGCSPRVLIQTVRMRHAHRLLEMTDLPVDEIAARVGYSNGTALRKLSLKMTGLPPALLRNRQ